jgi:A/G-specific adenine glycosylase
MSNSRICHLALEFRICLNIPYNDPYMKRELDKKDITTIQSKILNWYQKNGRHNLPWRNLESQNIDIPYGVLVSELMLQQTQVDRVVPKFNQFIADYPTAKKLAAAPLSAILSHWSGLGYNRRAVLLHRAVQEITQTYKGIIPNDRTMLQTVPGIGPYTSGAILAFGYNLPAVVIDTNIERFFELLLFGYSKPSKQELNRFAERFIPANNSRDWHSGLMDLMTIVRAIRSSLEQQQKLISELQLKPTWKLPELSSAPLIRPKQSKFQYSKRFYRGLILSTLKNAPNHQSNLGKLRTLMVDNHMPVKYKLEEILHQLKRDGLLVYTGELENNTEVGYPN